MTPIIKATSILRRRKPPMVATMLRRICPQCRVWGAPRDACACGWRAQRTRLVYAEQGGRRR